MVPKKYKPERSYAQFFNFLSNSFVIINLLMIVKSEWRDREVFSLLKKRKQTAHEELCSSCGKARSAAQKERTIF